MSDGPAFFRAIEADPDDDTPRLVYADWLEEHATSDAERARAEFIRVQCELARDPERGRRATLAVRAEDLLNKYRNVWEAASPRRPPGYQVYVRGFVVPNFDAADFAKHGEALAAVMPLNYVALRRAPEAMTDLAACPALRHVRYLCLESNSLRNKHLPALLASPHLTNVGVLGLGNNQVGLAGCEALAATTALPALRVLALYGNSVVKDRGLKALAGAPWFANLVGLHVSGCSITSAGVTRLAGLPQTARLLSLDVADRLRDDIAARAILDSPHLSKLVRLWFPDLDLSRPVRDALHARFGDKLNLTSYRLDQPTGGAV